MRITIDIDDQKLDEVLTATGQHKKSPAVVVALDEFLENRRRQAFLDRVLAGKTDYQASNDEVEALSEFE
ncbi:MAG: type II toxin-antitoxin system VapB family antitoxin [Opitutaceae bacterium]|jgi:Arc/MetJ family transcription regulator|nr:type II toxin-antitoxin system VapB family antitoxin [Opitutaceae bacterium]